MRVLSLAGSLTPSFAAAVVMTLLAGGPLVAQTLEQAKPAAEEAAKDPLPPAPEAAARFSFNSVEGGFLRLDKVSGQVALCSQRSAGWACQTVPEDRAALDSEIARLQGEVTQLKSELAALRAPAAPPRPPADLAPRPEGDAKTDPKSGGLKMPTDEDISRARAIIQNIWRQFVDMVAEMQKDLQRKS